MKRITLLTITAVLLSIVINAQPGRPGKPDANYIVLKNATILTMLEDQG